MQYLHIFKLLLFFKKLQEPQIKIAFKNYLHLEPQKTYEFIITAFGLYWPPLTFHLSPLTAVVLHRWLCFHFLINNFESVS